MMDKKTLHNILSRPFELSDWRNLLTEIFGIKNFLQRPANIPLSNNKKAEAAFELGSFNTADDRIIGLYLVKIKPEVWLERNKVGLRELLRSVYKYDVDGALIVFEQGQKWRLSFVSDIKVLNDEGEVIEQATEPKRYTYLLGEDEKVRTPVERLSKLVNKQIYINDILNAFSVEALNEEFYKIVQAFFYQLVGGKIGKGSKTTDFGNGILQLPTTDRNVRQEFAVRLIGRTVFCWFLKMKKSYNGLPLLPETVLSSTVARQNHDYYRTILERLFFQTLNTPMNERLDNLPNGAEIVPFLNGGLFEPNVDDFYKPNQQTGLNDSQLNIADNWFLKFFEELEKYNFTVDENSVTEIEISVDPEMLGRIFENLLAEIDPDSGETARKATGSFYTPREIVDYMATASLVQYLNDQTGIKVDKLLPLFKMLEKSDIEFTLAEKNDILDALDRVKILDPACGSGAFPIGVLQKIVQSLQKLDPDAVMWKKRQLDRISNAIIKKQLKEKLESSGVEYARKIGVIQNSLYGVDVQPIAAEISKLRCFLSLIVDEHIDDTKSNRGIEPLPNLEFKFVTADALIKLPEIHGQVELNKRGKKSSAELEEELNEIRQEYIQSFGEDKKILKQKFKDTQKQLFDQQGLFGEIENNRYYKISNWNPFGHDKSNWFDPKWMFGVEKFDMVIGNPPYVLLQNTRLSIEEQNLLRKNYKTAQYKTDLFHLFFEQGFKYLKDTNAVLCYITPNTYLKNKHNNLLREYILKNSHVVEVVRFFVPIFKNASVDNAIIIAKKAKEISSEKIAVKDISDTKYSSLFEKPSITILQRSIMEGEFSFDFDLIGNPIVNTFNAFPTLKEFGRAYFGIQTFDRNTFVSKQQKDDTYKPVVDGGNVGRYFLKPFTEYVSFTNKSIKSGGNESVYQRERILVRQIGKYPEGCYCPPNLYALNTIYNIFTYDESRINIKYLLSLINSNSIKYYWIKTFSDSKETFPKIKKNPLEAIPIPLIDNNGQGVFCKLVDYVIFLRNNLINNPINASVPNTYITQLFEEVIDAMVMELYFEKAFSKAGVEFIKYAQCDFEDIEGKTHEESIAIIQAAYQKLREKDNEIRNNLKLMDIKLADIVMPIKTAGK